MRTLLLLALFVVPRVWGDVFIGPSTPTNRLLIESGRVMVISSVVIPARPFVPNASYAVGEPARVRITTMGNTYDRYLRSFEGITALVGPADLTVLDPAIISYRILVSDAFRNIFTELENSYEIEIPAGRTAHFLTDFRGYPFSFYNATLVRADQTLTGMFFSGSELEGPLRVIFTPHRSQEPPYPTFISYYLTDNATVVPNGVALQSGTGRSFIEVERSDDLERWSSSILIPVSNTSRSFYRLKIAP